ncbi:MAG: TIGR00269 family protein [Candidatus Bilamarchaeum sp.]
MDNNCSKCNQPASVYLSYASQHLCQTHFKRMFDKRFRKTIREHKMIKKGERVVVGLSGGKDSCVLLHCLADLKKDLPFELAAITIDEGIRGYRNKTLEIAKRECQKLDVEHHVFTYKKEAGKTMDEIVEKNPEDIPCSHCGILRRYLLNKAAKEVKAEKLAIGHNLDDTAQTVLMNIMKNETQRLGRLNEPVVNDNRFIKRIKPLMYSPEKEVAIYAILKEIELERMDCPYAKWAFRGHVRKMLNESEEKYPGTKFKIVNSLEAMEKYLRPMASETELITCSVCGEPTSQEVCMYCKTVKLINR